MPLHFLQWLHTLCQTLINSPICWDFAWGSVVWSEGHHGGASEQGHTENCKDEKMKTKPPAQTRRQCSLSTAAQPYQTLRHYKLIPLPRGNYSFMYPNSFLFIHSFLGWIMGELVGAVHVHGSWDLWWEPRTERGCAHTSCYNSTKLPVTRDNTRCSHPVSR